jgi:sugar/nucleoside kinase (ribokinase family)
MVQIVTVGELTLDHIILPDGTVRSNVIGGGCLYSAIGAQIWDISVGIHSVTGDVFFQRIIAEIANRGIDTTGVSAVPGNGLELWLLHESETAKQQVPKLSSAKIAELDAARSPLPEAYRNAKGFHLAPQSVNGHWKSLHSLRDLSLKAFISLDIQADSMIDSVQYADLSFCSQISAFLPSREEVTQIWRIDCLPEWMRFTSSSHQCCVAVKMGSEGSLVLDPSTGQIFQIPACKADVVDTTGAGDAYCGGFLAGLVFGRSIVECAAMGTVSASFIVEAYGALDICPPSKARRDNRLKEVLSKVSAASAPV